MEGNIEQNKGNSGSITDFIIGVSDGLTVPFALTTGLSVISDSTNFVFVAGIISIATGALMMGVGGYYTIQSEGSEHHHEVVDKEVLNEETAKQFYSKLGLPEEEQQQATTEIKKDHELWSKSMQQYQSTAKSKNSATASGLVIAISYIVGGLLPTLPYLLFDSIGPALRYAVIVTTIALFLFGWMKSKATLTNPWQGAVRETIVGVLAASSAYLVAQFFKN